MNLFEHYKYCMEYDYQISVNIDLIILLLYI